MTKYIDTHAHYMSRAFGKDAKKILEQMPEYVEKIIQVGVNTKTNLQALQLLSLYDYVYGIIGFCPTDVGELEKDFCQDAEANWLVFKKQLNNKRVVAIGEIGLDYKWDQVGNFVKGDEARIYQQKWFIEQLNLAKELNLPVCIHSRDAEEDTIRIFDLYDKIPGVIHCFSYGREAARKAIEKGLYLGIGGTSTYPQNKELREVIKEVPLERLLLETDAPYLSPQAVRRETNTSANIKYVIENIAELKGISYEEVVRQTNKNAYEAFPRLKNKYA